MKNVKLQSDIREANKSRMMQKNVKTKMDSKTGDAIEFEGIDFTQTVIQGALTVVSGGAFGILGIIIWVLKTILIVLYYIFVKIIPFLVLYIGIPTFILGVVMGLFFLGGHMLFIVIFFVGMFMYIRKLFGVIYKLAPPPNNNNNNLQQSYKHTIKQKI
jgi:hypothetical protein